MAYSLVTYATAAQRAYESEQEARDAVFTAWPRAAVSIWIDEVERLDHVVIWPTETSREHFDAPIGWVSRDVNDPSFDGALWARSAESAA